VLSSAVMLVPSDRITASMPGIWLMSETMPRNIQATIRLTTIVRGQPTGTPSSRREMKPRMRALTSAETTTASSFTRQLCQALVVGWQHSRMPAVPLPHPLTGQLFPSPVPPGTGARPVTHVRLSIYPDGGMARLRLYGVPQLGDLARRWYGLLPDGQAARVRHDAGCATDAEVEAWLTSTWPI